MYIFKHGLLFCGIAEHLKRPLNIAQNSLTCGLPGCKSVLTHVVEQNHIV